MRSILQSADFVSLHVPLNNKTRHLMNAERFKLLKPTAYLINTARGGLVDEQALEQALREKWISGAALDVLENEPWSLDSPLRDVDNLIVTPHCAWYTERAEKELRVRACGEVIRVLRGTALKNLVNQGVTRYIGRRKSTQEEGRENEV